MDDIDKIKEYVLKNYKNLFIKKIIKRDAQGRALRPKYIDLQPIITIKKNHIEIKNHKDASPLILNKNILNERK